MRNLSGFCWLLVAVLFWLLVLVCLVLVKVYVAVTGLINRQFDVLFDGF